MSEHTRSLNTFPPATPASRWPRWVCCAFAGWSGFGYDTVRCVEKKPPPESGHAADTGHPAFAVGTTGGAGQSFRQTFSGGLCRSDCGRRLRARPAASAGITVDAAPARSRAPGSADPAGATAFGVQPRGVHCGRRTRQRYILMAHHAGRLVAARTSFRASPLAVPCAVPSILSLHVLLDMAEFHVVGASRSWSGWKAVSSRSPDGRHAHGQRGAGLGAGA